MDAASPAGKTSFTLFDASDGRRYKVYLKPSDFSKLKITKIRKTLCQVAQLQPEEYELCTADGTCLDTTSGVVYGSDIGLCEGTVLTIRRYAVPPSVSFEPQQQQMQFTEDDKDEDLPTSAGARGEEEESLEYRRAAADRASLSRGASAGTTTSQTSSAAAAAATPAATRDVQLEENRMPLAFSFDRRNNNRISPRTTLSVPAVEQQQQQQAAQCRSSPSPSPAPVSPFYRHPSASTHSAHHLPAAAATTSSAALRRGDEREEDKEGSASAHRQAALQAQLLREASQNRLFGEGTPLRLEDLGVCGSSSPAATAATCANGVSKTAAAMPRSKSAENAAFLNSAPMLVVDTKARQQQRHQEEHHERLLADNNSTTTATTTTAAARDNNIKDSEPDSAVTTHTRADAVCQLQRDIQQLQQVYLDDMARWKQEKAQLVQQLEQKQSCKASSSGDDAASKLVMARAPSSNTAALSSPSALSREELGQLLTTLDFYRHQLTQFDSEKADMLGYIDHVTAEKQQVETQLTAAHRSLDSIVRSSPTSQSVREGVEQLLSAHQHIATSERLEADNARLRDALDNETRKRRALLRQVEEMKGNIRVIVRMRPCCSKLKDIPTIPLQLLGGIPEIDSAQITIDEVRNTICVGASSGANMATVVNPVAKTYEFYRVFGDAASQADVFEEVAPLVQTAVDGVNTCVVAYGQTGSGKTHTILGGAGGGDPQQQQQIEEQQQRGTIAEHRGLLPRTVEKLFELLDRSNHQQQQSGKTSAAENNNNEDYIVTFTAIELYNDAVHSMLPPSAASASAEAALMQPQAAAGVAQGATKCEIRQGLGGVTVTGVTPVIVRSAAEAVKRIQSASKTRRVHGTMSNAKSSRSHALFTFNIQSKSTTRAASNNCSSSKLIFADLAGSERVSRSQSTGERLREAQCINKSLSALGDVVHVLSRSQQQPPQQQAPLQPQALNSNNFVPYRNSKLTMLLQDCIGGSAKAILVACIAPTVVPHEINTHETLSTLSFASRVTCVRNTYNAQTLGTTYSNYQLQSQLTGACSDIGMQLQMQMQQQQLHKDPTINGGAKTPTNNGKRWKI